MARHRLKWTSGTMGALSTFVMVALTGLVGWWVYVTYGSNAPAWVWIAGAMLVANYGFSVLGEKLDGILWTLEDIRARLPEPPNDDFDPTLNS